MRLQKNHFPVCSSSPEKEHKQNIVPPAARTRLRPRPAPGTPSRTRARTWHRAVGLLLTHPPGASLCLKSAFPLSRNTSRLLESLIRRVEGWSIPVSPPWEGCPCPTAWSHEQILEPSAATRGSERPAASPKLAEPQLHSRRRTNFWTKG